MTELDHEIVARAQQGDEDACRELLEILHRPVLATVYRFLGRPFHADVEDIAQDVFLKVFRSIDRFDLDRGVKFTTWVYTFVRNHCFDVLKKRRLRTVSLTSPDVDEGQWELQDQHGRTPEASAENMELGSKIREALTNLGEDQRMVFILREYEGLEYAAIAQVMDVSEGTVKSRLHRAKENLRNQLQPYLSTGT